MPIKIKKVIIKLLKSNNQIKIKNNIYFLYKKDDFCVFILLMTITPPVT